MTMLFHALGVQDYKCSSSPYTLYVTSQLVPTASGLVTEVTTALQTNVRANTSAPCYTRLTSSVQRVVFLTGGAHMHVPLMHSSALRSRRCLHPPMAW